jgi:fermentation-respiration switch protein FrsA (DUF1100 family)
MITQMAPPPGADMSILKHAAVLLALAASAADGQITGDWRGYWTRAGDTMAVTVHLRQDAGTRQVTATFDSDRLRVMGIPFNQVMVTDSAIVMRLQGDRTATVFNGTIRGNTIRGAFEEAGTNGAFSYTRLSEPVAVPVEREVTFRNGDVTLAGSLILPATRGRHSAVIFLHGSGAEGRFASRFLAMRLVERGVAALIFDKRGVGKSTGDWRTATIDDLAGDAIARRRLPAPRAGRRSAPDRRSRAQPGRNDRAHDRRPVPRHCVPRRIVRVGRPDGLDGDLQFAEYGVWSSRGQRAIPPTRATTSVRTVRVAYHGAPRARLDSLAAKDKGQPWYFAPPAADASYWSFSRTFNEFKPSDWWRQVHVPVLLIYGSADQRVPARESAARITEALSRAAGRLISPYEFWPAPITPSACRLEPGGWPETAPDYLSTLLDWIARREPQASRH